MSRQPAPRRVLRGPNGSIAVEIRRYAKPDRAQIVAADGDHVALGAEAVIEGLLRAGWCELTERSEVDIDG